MGDFIKIKISTPLTDLYKEGTPLKIPAATGPPLIDLCKDLYTQAFTLMVIAKKRERDSLSKSER
jgi:hypothetical protein